MEFSKDKAKEYNKIKVRSKLQDIGLTFIYLAVFQVFLSNPLYSLTEKAGSNFYLNLFLYVSALSFLFYLISFPLHFYNSFLTEKKFNLSKETFFTWLKDDVKGGLLSFAVFALMIGALYFTIRAFPSSWWIWIAVFYFFLTIIITKLLPVAVVPIFFKYQPVDEKTKEEIFSVSKKCGIKIVDVYKIDFSKKTSKLNAAVIGLGNTRRVILADTILEALKPEELNSVLAHEFGHHKLRHTGKLIFFGLLSSFVSFYVLFLTSKLLAKTLGFSEIYDIRVFPAFMIVLYLIGVLLGPIHNAFSRKLEKEADIFSLRSLGKREVFISMMNKLAEKNLADPDPPKFVKFMFYTHPPINERIQLAEKYRQR